MYILIDEKQGILGDVTIEDVVNAVHDGDSVKQGKTWVRVLGLDCPEVISNHVSANQPQGVEAGKFARDLVKGKSVKVAFWGKDKNFKRPLVKVSFEGKDFAQEVLISGFGWYVYSPKLTESERNSYRGAVKAAKAAKKAIWSEPKPIKPSEWRATHRYFK